MNTNQILYSPLPPNESGDHVLSNNHWILQTELIHISKIFEETKETSNSNKQTTRKPVQDRTQIENLTRSETKALKPTNDSGNRFLDESRLKVSKLKIPTRTPVVFRQISQDKASMSQILDFLYLGNSRDARNFESLKKVGITHVINATHDLPNHFEDSGEIKYLRVPVEDCGTADLMSYFTNAIEFIDGAIRMKGRILVHCQEGISRSASLVVAYIMAHSNLSLMHVLAMVGHARPIICPNINFLGQLDKFYQSLQHSCKSRLQSYLCMHKSVKQIIAKRFQEYQAETSKVDKKSIRPQKYHERDSSRMC